MVGDLAIIDGGSVREDVHFAVVVEGRGLGDCGRFGRSDLVVLPLDVDGRFDLPLVFAGQAMYGARRLSLASSTLWHLFRCFARLSCDWVW